jgi:hypothetical protein
MMNVLEWAASQGIDEERARILWELFSALVYVPEAIHIEPSAWTGPEGVHPFITFELNGNHYRVTIEKEATA